MRKLLSFSILLVLGSVPVFSATTLDLTTAGSSGTIGSARFYQFTIKGGTGVTDAF